ncbi:MAG: hypothetical protein ACOC2U_03500 [bacterium]
MDNRDAIGFFALIALIIFTMAIIGIISSKDGSNKEKDRITAILIENDVLQWNINPKTGEKYLIYTENDGKTVKKIEF